MIIEVPGHGNVEFPDDMPEAEILEAVRKLSMGADSKISPEALDIRQRMDEDPEAYWKAELSTDIREDNPVTSRLFPRVAKEITTDGDVNFSPVKGLMDLATIPGRTVGGLLDITFNDQFDNTFDQNQDLFVESMESPYGENIDRSVGGGILQYALRDPISYIPVGSIIGSPLKQGARSIAQMVAPKLAEYGGKGLVEASKVKGLREALPEGVEGVGNQIRALKMAEEGEPFVREAVEASPGWLKRNQGKLATTGIESGMYGGAEFGRQVVEGEDNPYSIAMAMAAPPVMGAVGEGLKQLAVRGLRGKYKLKPTDQARRFDADPEILLEEGLVPVTPGGIESTIANVQSRLGDVNQARGQVLSNLENKRRSALGIARDINPQLETISTENISNIIQQTPRSERTPLRQAFAAKQLLERSSFDIDQLRNEAYAKIQDAVMNGGMGVGEATKLLQAVEEELADFGYRVTEGATHGSLIDLQKVANRWFDAGKVNRPMTNAPLRGTDPQVAELMWESTRPIMEESLPGFKETSSQYRKYLPLEEALKGKAASVGQRDLLDPTKLVGNILSSNPVVTTAYKVGKSLETPGATTAPLIAGGKDITPNKVQGSTTLRKASRIAPKKATREEDDYEELDEVQKRLLELGFSFTPESKRKFIVD